MSELISTSQAMRILGVGSTTIKRWANEKKLPFVRTLGGHRRYLLTDVESLLQSQSGGMPQDLLDVDDWIKLLVGKTDVTVVRETLNRLHNHYGNWFQATDFLGGLLEQIGLRWAAGDVSIVEEHIASSLLDHAMLAIAANIRIPDSAPVGLLATLTGERHTLGLSLTQLCLKSRGLQPLWVGADTPVDELVSEINLTKPALVALSASRWSTDAGSLAKGYRDIVMACQAQGTVLILGGQGVWPENDDYGHRCHTFEDLRMELERLELV